jgi:hypothetical protein
MKFDRIRPARATVGHAGLIPEYTPAMGMPPQGTLEVAVSYRDSTSLPNPLWHDRPAGWYITRANDPIAGPFTCEADAHAYVTKTGWTPV